MDAEDPGHGGQDTGSIGDIDAQVPGAPQVVGGTDARSDTGHQPGRRSGPEVVGGVDEITEHGGGGGEASGAPTVEHELAGGGALDEDSVEGTAHGGQRVRAGEHGRMNADRDLGRVAGAAGFVEPFGHGQEFHHVSEPVGEGDVDRVDRCDPLSWHVRAGHHATEGQAGQDGGLGGGVMTVDISRRVSFGESEALRLAQGIGVGQTLLGHGRQDEIGGPVDDPDHAPDALSGQ